jgi:hypothetical protein
MPVLQEFGLSRWYVRIYCRLASRYWASASYRHQNCIPAGTFHPYYRNPDTTARGIPDYNETWYVFYFQYIEMLDVSLSKRWRGRTLYLIST